MSRKNQLIIAGSIVVLVVIAIGFFVMRNDEPETKMHNIGIFVMDHMVESMEAFQADMTRRGFIEGENINYQIWMFEQEALPDADTLAELDVLLALEAGDDETEPLGVAAGLVSDDVAIVFIADNRYPLEGGYVEDVTLPGGNVTGVLQAGADSRRFEIFTQILPEARQIVIPYDSSEPDTEEAISALQELAAAADIQLIPVGPDDFAAYVSTYEEGDVDAIFSLQAHDFIGDIIAFSQAYQLPIAADDTDVEAQGITDTNYFVMAYYGDEDGMSLQAAGMVEQILNGSDPANMRVENSTSLLTINLALAEAYGIEIQDGILEQADEIIRP